MSINTTQDRLPAGEAGVGAATDVLKSEGQIKKEK
jgi:hypothetical protein